MVHLCCNCRCPQAIDQHLYGDWTGGPRSSGMPERLVIYCRTTSASTAPLHIQDGVLPYALCELVGPVSAALASIGMPRASPTSRRSYRGTSLIRNCPPLGTYSRAMPRALWWSYVCFEPEEGGAGRSPCKTGKREGEYI